MSATHTHEVVHVGRAKHLPSVPSLAFGAGPWFVVYELDVARVAERFATRSEAHAAAMRAQQATDAGIQFHSHR